MGKLTAIRHQENPDGFEGHRERERLQEASKQFPPKKRYIGGEQHWFTKPPVAEVPKRQARALQRLEMRQTCEDYTDRCKLADCQFCSKKDERTQQIVDKAKKIIETFENTNPGTKFIEENFR